MGYTEVKIVQDNDGHNYVIPVTRWEEFHKMLEEDNDETFNQEFKNTVLVAVHHKFKFLFKTRMNY